MKVFTFVSEFAISIGKVKWFGWAARVAAYLFLFVHGQVLDYPDKAVVLRQGLFRQSTLCRYLAY